MRASMTKALGTLIGSRELSSQTIFIPERKVEEVLRSGSRLPKSLTEPIGLQVAAHIESALDIPPTPTELIRVARGSIGVWDGDRPI